MPADWSEWKRTTAAVKWTRGTLALPPCCYCRRPARDTEVSFYEIEPGTPIDDIPYCLPSPRIRCAPDKGCNADPKSKRGWHLREGRWDGPPPFLRVRDNTYWGFME